MAFANPHITADAIEATEFMDLSRRYRVTGVPKTIVNETIEILGAPAGGRRSSTPRCRLPDEISGDAKTAQ